MPHLSVVCSAVGFPMQYLSFFIGNFFACAPKVSQLFASRILFCLWHGSCIVLWLHNFKMVLRRSSRTLQSEKQYLLHFVAFGIFAYLLNFHFNCSFHLREKIYFTLVSFIILTSSLSCLSKCNIQPFFTFEIHCSLRCVYFRMSLSLEKSTARLLN